MQTLDTIAETLKRAVAEYDANVGHARKLEQRDPKGAVNAIAAEGCLLADRMDSLQRAVSETIVLGHPDVDAAAMPDGSEIEPDGQSPTRGLGDHRAS